MIAIEEEVMEFSNIDEVLGYAIAREREAAALYTELADRVSRPELRQLLLDFASQERRHRERLEMVRGGELSGFTSEIVQTLKIADHLGTPEPTAHMTYREALLFAVKSEGASYAVSSKLAEMTDDDRLNDVFCSLAREEAVHKLKFEQEYQASPRS